MYDLIADGLRLTGYITLVFLSVYSLIGLFVAFVQTVTSVQEQCLAFLFKLIASFIILLASGTWMFESFESYSKRCFQAIERVGQS